MQVYSRWDGGSNEDQQSHNIPPDTTPYYYDENNVTCDVTHSFVNRTLFRTGYSTNETKDSTTYYKLAYAADPTVGTPTLSGETTTTITVNANVDWHTSETTAYAYVEYKATAGGSWAQFGGSVRRPSLGLALRLAMMFASR
jgi:hypothetical protein